MELFDKIKKGFFLISLCFICLGQVMAQNEAQIGSTEYATLEEAIAHATSGDVVEIIVANCGIVNTTPIPAGITIKGQGKTATTMLIESTSGSGLTLNYANVTLKDMTIDGSQVTTGGYKTLVNVRADGCLITDVVMTGGGQDTWNSSILVETLNATQTFTVSNSTISGSFRGVLRESCNANIVITNCDITATYPFNIDGGSGGTVTVTGGALHGWTSYSGVDHVTFTNVTFSKVGYDCVAAYVNTTFNNCTMDNQFNIYAQTSGFTFELNNCTKGGVNITNENFTELFPADPDVWNACVTVVNEVILVGTQTKLDNAAASGPTNVSTRMTKSFEYDGNLCPNITSLIVNGDNGGDSTLTFSNCTFGSTTTPATLTLAGGEYTLSATCSNGCNVTLEHVAIVLGENASFTVNGQTDFFKPAQYYIIKETANGNGTYTYSTQYVGVATIGETGYPTLNAAAAAVPVGTPTTITILQNLNFYDIAQSNIQNKTITFTGTATDTLTLSNAGHPTTNASGANLTFETITLKNDMEPDGENRGIIHLSNLTINDCEIIGFMRGFASEQTVCNNCTFTKTGKYHMWTYGSNCTFNGCTFNSYGNGNCKAINIYKEGDLSQAYRTVTFNDCAFNSIPAVTTLDNSAIQINSNYCCFVVYINNCSVNGYINNTSSITGYPNLVNNKSTSVATTLYIDGVQILKQGSCDPVAKIDETYYTTLQDALDAAHDMTGDVTVNLIRNTAEDVTISQKAGLNYTINGNNDTLNGRIFVDGKRLFPTTDPGEVVITNLNFTYNDALTYIDDTKGFICNSKTNLSYAAHVTVSNCTFDGGADGVSYGMTAYRDPAGAQSWDITLDHLVAKNCHSLVQATSVSGLKVTHCKAIDNVKNGINISGGGSGHIPGVTNVFTIVEDTLTCNSSGEYSLRLQQLGYDATSINLSGNVFTATKSIVTKNNNTGDTVNITLNVSGGLYKGILSSEGTDNTTNSFTGGTFTEAVATVQTKCAEGYMAIDEDPTVGFCTVHKMYWVTYDANGGTGTPMTPSYVAPSPGTTFEVKDNEGYTYGAANFTGWNTKADGTGDPYAAGATMAIESDTTLYAQWGYVAMIGTTPYATLQAAVDSANKNMTGDVTIDLVQNTTEIVTVLQKAENNLTINGNGNTLTGQMFISANGNNWDGTDWITIQNLKFKYDVNYFEGTGDEIGLLMFCKHCYYISGVNCYAHNITIENCDFDADGSNKGVYGVAVVNSVKNITVDHCTAQNAMGLALMQSGTPFAVTNCKANDVTYGLRLRNNTGPHTIANDTIVAEEIGIYVDYYTTNTALNLSDNKFEAPIAFKLDNTCTGGTFNITGGTYIGTFEDNATSDFFNISGGTYSEDVTGDPCAPGYAAFANGTTPETWTVAQAWFLYYDKNETEAEGTMDTLFVRRDGTAAERTLEVAPCEFTWLPNHSFKEWNTKADGTGTPVEVGNSIELTSDTTLYVIWQEGNTIFYHNNGGTGTIANQYKAVDQTITLSDGTGFSKTDSTLYRWNTAADESGTNYALGAEYSADANLDLYAVWRKNLNMTMNSTDVVCYGENNGTDTVKIIGGDPTYMIVLSSTVLAQNDTVRTSETQYVFTNLKPGDYNVELSDTLKKDFITGTFTIAQPDTLVISSLTVPDAPCPLMGTGEYAVSMTTTGGNGGNTITWEGDAENVNALSTTVTPDADDRDRTYTVTVTVTDSKNCSATQTATFSVAPVIANDGTTHSNTTMTVAPISQSILYGCDTVIRNFGTPEFVFTNPAITEDILDTVYNNVATAFPDSIFTVGENTIIWTAVDTCGHTVTAEQTITITHKPCPTVTDYDEISYPAVRIGCDCWTTKNLVSTHYSYPDDHSEIPDVRTYPINTRASVYGNLYTYEAAMHGETVTGTTPVQGACPEGWHVPSQAEAEALMSSSEVRDLMSQGTWIPDNGTNASGFNILPGGFYNAELDRYERMYVSAYFWIAVPATAVYHACEFGAACSSLELIPGSLENGFSIRCVLTKPTE